MIIGGLQKFSLIDYPGKIASIIFTQGCNFACEYCHNKELTGSKKRDSVISPDEIFSFLNQRQKKLDAVVITGGEPTLQPDLIEFIAKIKHLGFLVKLDTNGSSPEVISELLRLKLIDYIAMDIKAPMSKYSDIAGVRVEQEKILASIDLVKNSSISHEFRTTVLKSQLSEQDIMEIGELARGATYNLQKYQASKELENRENYSDSEFEKIRDKLIKNDTKCFIR